MHRLARAVARGKAFGAVILVTACLVGSPAVTFAESSCATSLCAANHTFLAPAHVALLTTADLAAGSSLDGSKPNVKRFAFASSLPSGASAILMFTPDGDLSGLAIHTGPGTSPLEVPYVLTDGMHYATATLTIVPTLGDIAAANLSFTATAGTPLTVTAPGLLKGGSDLPGVPITVQSVSTSSTKGSVTFQSNGSFTYTPAASFVGTDTFSFTLADGVTTLFPTGVDTASAKVMVEVVDPTIGSSPITGTDGGPGTITAGPTSATPELDSLLLLGSGLAGLGAYALRGWRARR